MDRIDATFGNEAALLALRHEGDDGSHDLLHLLRVARNAIEIADDDQSWRSGRAGGRRRRVDQEV
jgi:HD superfamily phosphodiesterase